MVKFFVSIIFLLASCAAMASDYAGSTQCAGCHESEHALWRSSDHFQSMLPATTESVLGDFSGVTVQFHEEVFRLFTEDDRFWVETNYVETDGVETDGVETDGENNKQRLEVKYTFGHRPLQQYLVELAGGRLQALNLSWDSRTTEDGGNRWFHLQDEMSADSPFRWSRHLQNWNGRCAECHSTNLEKGFNTETLTYETTFSEVNVACEACHGPGASHVKSAIAGNDLVPMTTAAATLTWQFGEGRTIASPTGDASAESLNMCGGCHSRRTIIGDISPAKPFDDQYQLALLDQGLYHADGQIQDEVFVLGSFLQSKMHGKGVTCMNCHNAHTGKVLFEDNRLCAQCHNPTTFDVSSHLRHEKNTSGAICVDCHMPETTYMKIDPRRDHRFGIPNPALSARLDVPNACNSCHSDESPAWAEAAIAKDVADDGYADLNARVRSLDLFAAPDALRYIGNVEHAPIKRATLLANLPLSQASVGAAVQYLQDDSELLRVAAVQLLNAAPAAIRVATLPVLANDVSRAVRRAAGRALIDVLADVSEQDTGRVTALVDDYRASLAPSEDMPSTQTALAQLQASQGEMELARQSLGRAIQIEPHYVPALLNLADMYRGDADEAQARALLKRAIEVAPDSGAVNHSYGLALIRQGDPELALPYLLEATRCDDRQPRYAYVYAVALDAVTRTSEAVNVLAQASKLWPGQYDLLILEVVYREKAGLISGIKTPLRILSRLAPQDPQVAQRLQRYQVF
jgi:tetratricopeptide (TPR) repeat protein